MSTLTKSGEMTPHAMRGHPTGWVLALVLALAAGCQLPRDPDGTLERVRGGTLRAGMVVSEPWTRLEDGRPAGVEVALVEELAKRLGARVTWTVGNEGALMEAVEHGALDVVVGGLSAKTPWGARVGLGHPYLTSLLQVGAPPGQTAPSKLEGVPVAVEIGSAAGHHAQLQRAQVQETTRLAEAPGLRVAWDWQLEGWGYLPSGSPLHEEKTVWVVPPGENAWLLTVNRFVLERSGWARQQMVEAIRRAAGGARAEVRR